MTTVGVEYMNMNTMTGCVCECVCLTGWLVRYRPDWVTGNDWYYLVSCVGKTNKRHAYKFNVRLTARFICKQYCMHMHASMNADMCE